MTTNVSQFIADLDAGVFEQKLSHVLSETASAVIDHGEQGKVTLELSFKRLGNSHQVAIAHKIKTTRPTMRGKVSEEETTETPMWVGAKGALSFFPENQNQLFDKKGQPETGATQP